MKKLSTSYLISSISAVVLGLNELNQGNEIAGFSLIIVWTILISACGIIKALESKNGD